MTMTTSLVQRLDRPPKTEKEAMITQAFGGGMMAISKEQWAYVQTVFNLFYMGAAEYEFGSFPNAIRELLANISEYGAWEFTISADRIKPNYWRSNIVDSLRRREIAIAKDQGKKPPRLNRKKLEELAKIQNIKDAKIYVFGLKDRKVEIEDMIVQVAREEMDTKNGAGMARALDPDPSSDYDTRTCGWFDLKNKVFWFTDEKMWKGTINLFGPSPVQEEVNAAPPVQ